VGVKNINSKTRSTIFCTGLLVIFLFCCGTASAATVYVNPGTDAIKNAISSANSGDTIYLRPGTYTEHNLVVNKDLTISGPKVTTGNPTAVIDGQQLDRVFIVNEGKKVTMKYLTIQNGATILDDGGGILNYGDTLNVKGCNIKNNFADVRGGGICSSGTLNVYNSNINNNEGHFYGGGIFIYGPYSLTVSDSLIENNNAGRGGGICTYGTSKITTTNFYSNDAIFGAGIYNGATSTVTNCEFKLNEAQFGNAFCSFYTDSSVLRYNRFLDSHNSVDTSKNHEIYAEGGSADASYNWWGSNNSPSNKISTYQGTVDFTPWITDVTGAPKFSSSSPTNGATNVPRTSTIKVNFNEYIKAGSNFIELKTSTGTVIEITVWLSGKVLNIKPKSKLAANTKYLIYLHTGCVTDHLNNKLSAKTFSFTTGST
jgi:hypothetical protein